MKVYTSTQARANKKTTKSQISIKNASVTWISEGKYLCAIPGMKQSIQRGLKTPLKNCAKALDY